MRRPGEITARRIILNRSWVSVVGAFTKCVQCVPPAPDAQAAQCSCARRHVGSRNLCADMDGVDLNLLPALDVLLTEGSVTGAARRLGLSASAMSRTLARSRSMTGDPLLVRAGSGLFAKLSNAAWSLKETS